MKLDIYKGRKIIRTVKTDAYDISLGTVEDVLHILDDISMTDELSPQEEVRIMYNLVRQNFDKLKALLLDMFIEDGLTEEELKHVRLKDMIPLFVELLAYVKESFGTDPKN
ncbi:hypothetical protein MKC54_10970 [[Clostridium] innocuum]|nr:hypothetical protein [[Clostridium] innocuum]MCR0577407.1 hypothetical protein [[Clostridium] innocuum]